MSTFKKRTIKRCEQVIKKENTIKKKKKRNWECANKYVFLSYLLASFQGRQYVQPQATAGHLLGSTY